MGLLTSFLSAFIVMAILFFIFFLIALVNIGNKFSSVERWLYLMISIVFFGLSIVIQICWPLQIT